MLYGCGLRTDELCALDVAQINRERHELTVLHAKGDRPRSDSLFPKRSTQSCWPIFSSMENAGHCFEPAPSIEDCVPRTCAGSSRTQ